MTAGEKVGPYRIESAIGSGAFAEVYRARHEILDQVVALKVIREPGVESLEQTGARIMCRLDHPNIVKVSYADRIDGLLVIAMEYVDGETLEDRMRREGPMTPGVALEWLIPVCSALEYLHAQDGGCAHLDLKPSNLLISAAGIVKLTDFGVAALPGTDRREVRGSLLYMAPEQFEGAPVQQSDLWAFGVILFRMIMGRAPAWKAFPPVQGLPATDLAALPEVVRPIIARCLEADMEKRFSNATDLKTAVEDAAQSSCPRCGSETHDGMCVNCTHAEPFKIRRTPVANLRGSGVGRGVRIAAGVVVMAILVGGAAYGGYTRWQDAQQRQHNLDNAWKQLIEDEKLATGLPADSVAHAEQFLKLCGNCAQHGQAADRRSKWQKDAQSIQAALETESKPDARMSDKARTWKQTAETVVYPRSKTLASARAKAWQTQVAKYDGYAQLTVLAAHGLPKAEPTIWGNGMPDPYIVVRQTGLEAFQTRTLEDAVAPAWNQSGRLRWKPGLVTTIELRDRYLLGSRLLAQFALEPGTPDGEVKLRSNGMELKVDLHREK